MESFPLKPDHVLPLAYTRVSAHYGVARLRYPPVLRDWDAGWIAGCAAARNASRHERAMCLPHPPHPSHRMLAAVVALSFIGLADALTLSPRLPAAIAAPDPLPPALTKPQARRVGVCRSSLSSYSAADPAAARGIDGVRVTRGVWDVLEDRRGKPGWITKGPAGSEIAFELRFGAQPSAQLVFLRGYSEDLGEIELTMDVRPPTPVRADEQAWRLNRVRVDARRHDGLNVTQATVLFVKADDRRCQNYAMQRKWPRDFAGVVGFGVPPHSNATLRVALLGAASSPPPPPPPPRAPTSSAAWRHLRSTAPPPAARTGASLACAACKFKILAVSAC